MRESRYTIWGRFQEIRPPLGTFNVTSALRIGSITAQRLCPFKYEKFWRSSELYVDHLGTEADHWRLAERQILCQGC